MAADTGGSRSSRTVYQQRQPDGTLLLTDRIPYGSDDRVLEQRWTFPAEDPARAAERRAEVRAEYEAVTERIHQMVAQRDRIAADVAIERMRMESAHALLEAEREHARREAGPTTVMVPVWPRFRPTPH